MAVTFAVVDCLWAVTDGDDALLYLMVAPRAAAAASG